MFVKMEKERQGKKKERRQRQNKHDMNTASNPI